MAVITNYTTLQTAVTDYLARTDLSTFVPNFVQNFEERFYRDPKNFGSWMETAYTQNIASGVIAVPNDFLAWKVVAIGSPARKLQPVPLSQLFDKFPRGGETGYPKLIARNGSNFNFGPIPDSAYEVSGTYFAKPANLRTDSDGANWLTANAPDLLLYGSLKEAEPFLKNDERVALWSGFYDSALAAYRDLQRATDLSGGPLQVLIG